MKIFITHLSMFLLSSVSFYDHYFELFSRQIASLHFVPFLRFLSRLEHIPLSPRSA